MAEQLIVLGNGFDLKCELRTSYSDFFEWLYKTKKNENTNVDEELKSQKEEIVEKNFWMILFWELHKKFTNWADVESIIEKTLIFADENYEYCLMDYKKANRFSYRCDAKYLYDYQAYLQIIKGENISGFDFSLYGKYAGKLDLQDEPTIMQSLTESNILMATSILLKTQYLSYSNKTDFFKEILLDLYEFEKEFELFIYDASGYEYLQYEYELYANDLLERICFSELKSQNINLLNFNYTHPLSRERCKNIEVENIFNVHGKALEVKLETNHIIFGIDNKNYKPTDLEYPFTKTFRTMVLYSDLSKPTYAVEENVFDENIKVIKFYGHSLAEADYSYFQAMFDYYDLYNNNDLKLFFYFSTYGTKTSQEMILEQADRVTTLIEKYGETLDNKNHGKNLLTRLIQTKRLFIKEI